MTSTSEKIFKIAKDIEDVLHLHDLASPNPRAVERIRSLATQLKTIDTYAAGKANRIAVLAEQFYSDRKHQGRPGQLYDEMRTDLLNRIRKQAQDRRTNGD